MINIPNAINWICDFSKYYKIMGLGFSEEREIEV